MFTYTDFSLKLARDEGTGKGERAEIQERD
jgi:hypothetical protein